MSITLDRGDARYRVGRPLKARWRIGPRPVSQLAGLEASVLWYTEGKGEEDLHVHHFQRWNENQLRELDPRDAMTLQCELPYSPLSYQGTLLRIHWCVRLRLFCSTGPETVVQTPFQLVHDTSDAASPREKQLQVPRSGSRRVHKTPDGVTAEDSSGA